MNRPSLLWMWSSVLRAAWNRTWLFHYLQPVWSLSAGSKVHSPPPFSLLPLQSFNWQKLVSWQGKMGRGNGKYYPSLSSTAQFPSSLHSLPYCFLQSHSLCSLLLSGLAYTLLCYNGAWFGRINWTLLKCQRVELSECGKDEKGMKSSASWILSETQRENWKNSAHEIRWK